MMIVLWKQIFEWLMLECFYAAIQNPLIQLKLLQGKIIGWYGPCGEGLGDDNTRGKDSV